MKRKTSIRLLGAAMVAAAVTPWLGGGTAAAVTPQAADGKVIEPQVSLPMAKGTSAAPTAAPGPLEDPPDQ